MGEKVSDTRHLSVKTGVLYNIRGEAWLTVIGQQPPVTPAADIH